MTDLIDAPVFDGGPDVRPRRKRWSARRTAALIVGVAAVVAGVAAWVLLPGLVALGRVQVFLDARPFTCARASDVTTWADEDPLSTDQQLYLPAVRMHPGLDCTMDVIVRNDSDAEIGVDSIAIPLAGPNNGTGMHAYRLVQQGLGVSAGKDAADAFFDYRHTASVGGSYRVAAHSFQRFGVHLSWSNGCMDVNTVESFTRAPTVVVADGPWHLAKTWDGAGYVFLGGKDTAVASCRH